MLASNCQVPLTAVLLLFELTRDYLIVLPALAAVGISFWVSATLAPRIQSAAAAAAVRAAALGSVTEAGDGSGGSMDLPPSALGALVSGQELTVACALDGGCVLELISRLT